MKSARKVLKYDLLIIGNGVAGNNAALSARANDPDMSIGLISREPVNEYAAGALPDFISGALKREDIFIKNDEDYREARINLLLGKEVTKVDLKAKKILLDDDTRLQYKKLIIATGSSPIIPPVAGHKLPGNVVLKTLADAENMIHYPGGSAVVVGSGAIGVEAALALKAKGYQNVSIIELMDWIFPKSFDEKPARIIEGMLVRQGITVLTGEKVTAVLGSDVVTGVKTDKREVPCDLVVWAVGVRPEVELAKKMGLKLGKTGGIAVDGCMQSSAANVYAAGDCVESTDIFSGQQVLNFLWDAACKQGKIAGVNCSGGNTQYSGSYAVLLTYIGDLPILSLGLNHSHLADEKYEVWERRSQDSYRRIITRDDYLLGIQMVGTLEGAGPVLFNLKKGMPISSLGEIIEEPAVASMSANSAWLKIYLDSFTKLSE